METQNFPNAPQAPQNPQANPQFKPQAPGQPNPAKPQAPGQQKAPADKKKDNSAASTAAKVAAGLAAGVAGTMAVNAADLHFGEEAPEQEGASLADSFSTVGSNLGHSVHNQDAQEPEKDDNINDPEEGHDVNQDEIDDIKLNEEELHLDDEDIILPIEDEDIEVIINEDDIVLEDEDILVDPVDETFYAEEETDNYDLVGLPENYDQAELDIIDGPDTDIIDPVDDFSDIDTLV